MYVRQYFLEANGIPLSQIIYVNFEDERLLEMTAEDLNLILEIGLEISEADIKPYLFLDEIQNINRWEKFVRRIADMKYRINITGSNSKMLSSEIASTLGGRFVIMNIYPYSFSECKLWLNIFILTLLLYNTVLFLRQHPLQLFLSGLIVCKHYSLHAKLSATLDILQSVIYEHTFFRIQIIFIKQTLIDTGIRLYQIGRAHV